MSDRALVGPTVRPRSPPLQGERPMPAFSFGHQVFRDYFRQMLGPRETEALAMDAGEALLEVKSIMREATRLARNQMLAASELLDAEAQADLDALVLRSAARAIWRRDVRAARELATNPSIAQRPLTFSRGKVAPADVDEFAGLRAPRPPE